MTDYDYCRHPAHYYPATSVYEGDHCFCGVATIPVGEGKKRPEPTFGDDCGMHLDSDDRKEKES